VPPIWNLIPNPMRNLIPNPTRNPMRNVISDRAAVGDMDVAIGTERGPVTEEPSRSFGEDKRRPNAHRRIEDGN